LALLACGCAARPNRVASTVATDGATEGATDAVQAVYRQPATPPEARVAPLFLVTAPDEPVARLPGLVISQRQFLAPLVEAHGLPVLLNVVQLELAKQNAQRLGLKLSPEELRQERDRTLEQAFSEADDKTQEQISDALARGDRATADRLREDLKHDRERALEQYLAQQRVSRPEFELLVQTNAYLRKIAERDMKEIPQETLRKAFDAEYGATVRVRHIQSNSKQEIVQAAARVKAGEPFEKVAREMSRNARTGPMGGELPKFSLAHSNVPANFKQAAFGLNEGQVSEIVQCDDAYHLIKLEQKFSPRAVKFEDVKDGLRNKVREQILQGAVGHLRDQMADQARTTLQIEDPVLREQFARRLDDRDRQIKEMDKIREQQDRERRAQAEKQSQGGAAGAAAAPAVDPQKVLPVPNPAPQPQPPQK
jgi:parvulin-like peptidyl-prolyl isomerase